MNKITYIHLFLLTLNIASANALQDYEQWWERYALTEKASDFINWLGDVTAPSRVTAREYIKNQSYKTFLDIGCGLCTEYFAILKEQMPINYCGLDLTPSLIQRARALGINVLEGSVENIPLEDSSFDICYVRHVLEHLPYYTKALSELIRVASKEILIIWFIEPSADNDRINAGDTNGLPVYHNQYNKNLLELFIKKNSKVSHLTWESIHNSQEIILHIYLKS